MYYLFIDTCVWIDLIELEKRTNEVREKILQLINEDKVVLVIHEIVINEWHRRKNAKLEKTITSLRGKFKNMRDLSLFLEPEEADRLDCFLDIPKVEKSIEQLSEREINAVEALFNHSSTVKIPITDQAKLQAVELALNKRAPFKDRKNSMADALIIIDSIIYATKNNLKNAIFISTNTADFAGQDKIHIHEDLKELLEECNMKYFSNIGMAMNEVKEGVISAETVEEIQRSREQDVEQLAAMFKATNDSAKEFVKQYEKRKEYLAAVFKTTDSVTSNLGYYIPQVEQLAAIFKAANDSAKELAEQQEKQREYLIATYTATDSVANTFKQYSQDIERLATIFKASDTEVYRTIPGISNKD